MAASPGIIRPATVDDLQRIHEIAVQAWTPIFNRYRCIVGDRMWQDVWGGWDANWVRFSPNNWHGRGIVTEVDGEVVGFAAWSTPSQELAEVGGNAVDARFQGQGVGTAQIRWVIDKFKADGHPAAKVHTGMDPAHGPARAEYRKAGLGRGVLNSVYFNYLDEVARIPVPSRVRFRWATPDDADRVRQIAEAAWAPVYDRVRARLGERLFQLAFGPVLQRRAEQFASMAAGDARTVRVAAEDARLVGFSVVEDWAEKNTGNLSTIAVDPEAQGRGVGAALCTDAFDVVRERGFAYVRAVARLGEVGWATRQLCWNVGLYRQLPSIDYYTLL